MRKLKVRGYVTYSKSNSFMYQSWDCEQVCLILKSLLFASILYTSMHNQLVFSYFLTKIIFPFIAIVPCVCMHVCVTVFSSHRHLSLLWSWYLSLGHTNQAELFKLCFPRVAGHRRKTAENIDFQASSFCLPRSLLQAVGTSVGLVSS